MSRFRCVRVAVFAVVCVPLGGSVLRAQTNATLQGRMFDTSATAAPGATIAEASRQLGRSVLRPTSSFERHRGIIIATAGGLLLQTLLIARLILEHRKRRRAEVESRRNLAAMAHLERRSAMGELATSLAHELNQPLTAILQNAGVARMLIRAHPLPPALDEIADIINDIHRDDVRASEIVRGLRGMLQKHEFDSGSVHLNHLVQETVAIVRPEAASRQILIEMDLADGLCAIHGDRVHLLQVLLNLMLNAMDAVTAMPPNRRRIRVWSMAASDVVQVGVTDTGSGISSERLEDVFEPFYTTKSDGRGMGMGLAIARGIVEVHAGHMAAENNTAGGATVWFSIPQSRHV